MSTFQWKKTDTASVMFTSLTNRNWGRTFRFSAEMNAPIQSELIMPALQEVKKSYPHVFTTLKTGLFWRYQQYTDVMPEVKQQATGILLPITARYRGRPDFRIVYSEREIAFEASHCLGDGKGLLSFFESFLSHYLSLQNQSYSPILPRAPKNMLAENAFEVYYDKNGEHEMAKPPKAFHLQVENRRDYLELLFASMPVEQVHSLAKEKGLTVTEYLTAVFMLGVIKSAKTPIHAPLQVFIPVNLRRFFESHSTNNFVIQSCVGFHPNGKTDWSLDDICNATKGELKKQLHPDNLKKTVNQFGSLTHNPVLRAVPYFIKKPVLTLAQLNTHASATTIFTNLGSCTLPDELQENVKQLKFVNGDTGHYGLCSTVSCVSANGILTLCWSQTTPDRSWATQCADILREQGIKISLESTRDRYGETSVSRTPSADITPVNIKTPFTLEKLKAFFNI